METEIVEKLATEIEPTLSAEEVAIRLDRLRALKDCVKAIEEKLTANLFGWLSVNGELTIGDRVWFIGEDKTTKCRNVRDALTALLEVTGGDMEEVANCLAASAWKPGAAKKVLARLGQEAAFEKLFETITRRDVNNKPVKKVIEFNRAFAK